MTSRGRRERGAALLVVLLALAALLPLALGLSHLVLRRQRQVGRWGGWQAGGHALEGAFDAARVRISNGAAQVRPGEQVTWPLTVGPRGVTVRVRRQEDVAVRLDGRVVDAARADFRERVIDADGDSFCPWLRLEVYLVEVEAEGTAGGSTIRLLGGVARLEDGRTLSLGQRRDARGG